MFFLASIPISLTDTITAISAALTAIGTILTGAGLIFAGTQVRLAQKTARSQFLLQLYQLMDQHNEVHIRLTGMGWSINPKGPVTREEWVKVGRLLGLFEYINILYVDRIIDADTIDDLYSYRLFHALNNDTIREKHFENKNRTWSGIISLLIQLRYKKIFSTLVSQNGSVGMIDFLSSL